MRIRSKRFVSLAMVLTLVLASVVGAQNDEPMPVIVIQEPNHNMGEIFEAKVYKHVFKVRNEGNADLVIENVKPG